ncbi:MAG: VaFE repeat-containing surface-anchored protein, partial [Eubacterium sp.]|nr:VaFE repeat-containing surface-anchored protein [Eubacterium sp.]
QSYVVFETCLNAEGMPVASHEDPDDKNQTVQTPGIRTSAVDGSTGNHTGTIGTKVTITDTVTYSNLAAGKKYTISGMLMDKETGKALKDKDGRNITAGKTFRPAEADGTIELEYRLDSVLLAGKTVVVFERLRCEGIEVASHADIEDETQSVHYPKIGTTASVNGKKEAEAGGIQTIRDQVAYENLVPGQTYVLNGQMMNRKTGNPVSIVKEVEFTAGGTGSGSVEVEFHLTTDDMAGAALVAFEELYSYRVFHGSETGRKSRIAEHKNLQDEGQTVTFKGSKVKHADEEKEDSEEDTPITTKTVGSVKTDDVQPVRPLIGALGLAMAVLSVLSAIRARSRNRKKQRHKYK